MNHNYRKFFASCLVRIANGYFFLLNVLMVLVQATGVLDSELLAYCIYSSFVPPLLTGIAIPSVL